jgi:dihydroorotate dehydrogenase
MWYQSIKRLLFAMSPEMAHSVTMWGLRLATRLPIVGQMIDKMFVVKDPVLKRTLFGLTFDNPVGLAAGFDKNGTYYRAMSHLGFGFIEVGTVTPRAQPGNPKPRLFRLTADEALINRMGFNNGGVEALVERLKRKRPKGLIVGGNIGKNKDTPNELAWEDYLACFEALYPVVDYFAVNISSPNTPGLRALQEREPLLDLLQRIQKLNKSMPLPKPVLLKIAPDLTDSQLDDIVDIVRLADLQGIIATNTTIERKNLETNAATLESIGAGGLSGLPLRERSTQVVHYLYKRTQGKIPIIAVGGIHHPEDAIAKIRAGASLVQLYTGLVYAGPKLVKEINEAIIEAEV